MPTKEVEKLVLSITTSTLIVVADIEAFFMKFFFNIPRVFTI